MHSALLKWLTKVSYAQLLWGTLFKQLYQIPNFLQPLKWILGKLCCRSTIHIGQLNKKG